MSSMDFDPTELPAWRMNVMSTFPPWNVGVLSSHMLKYVTRRQSSASEPHGSLLQGCDNGTIAGGLLYMQEEFDNTGGLTINCLKNIHRNLLPSDSERGQFRTCLVETPVLQRDSDQRLIDLLRKLKRYVKGGENPFKIAAWFTATFLAIHPFKNGNGKVSRVALAVLLNRALGFYLSWPLDKYGRISYHKWIGAWALQKSQIPLSPGPGKPMVSVNIAPPVDFCAFLLDCAWVAVCPRVTRTIKLRGPPMCGKKTLLEMINRTDFENERFLKTPKFQYEMVIHSEGESEVCMLSTDSSLYDMGSSRIVMINKMDLIDTQTAVAFFSSLQNAYPGITFIPLSAESGAMVFQRPPGNGFSWYTGPTLLEALDGL